MKYIEQLNQLIAVRNPTSFDVLLRLKMHLFEGKYFDLSMLSVLDFQEKKIALGALVEHYFTKGTSVAFLSPDDPLVTFNSIRTRIEQANQKIRLGDLPMPDVTISNNPYWYQSTIEKMAKELEQYKPFYQRSSQNYGDILHIDTPSSYTTKPIK